MIRADKSRRIVLILAPVGRDATAIAGLIDRAGLCPVICDSTSDLIENLGRVVEVVVVAEEALYGKNARVLEGWVTRQPPWSDQPFIVLTHQNESPKFAAFRRELVTRLRHVAFLERPLQGMTLQSAVLSAERARKRQYEARAHLEAQRGVADKLEQLVAERTTDLEQANSKLRDEIASRQRAQAALLQAQKIEALGQLVGGVAHDFNNLLMAVIGNLDLLSKRLGQDARTRRLLDGAMEGARRGATLTQRLLAFARKQELQTQATDLRSLVDDMRHLLGRSVGPLVRIEIESDKELPAVTVDPNQLEMALLNLAVNARDAMPSGGVLTIRLASEVVTGGNQQLGLRAGQFVVLAVTDTGEGMDAETLAKAVEPFFSTKAVGKGTGLGLSMVFGLAKQSGGSLQLESTPGAGTTARLWLPVATTTAVHSEKTSVITKHTERAKILFIDDDPLIAGSSVALLEDLGHEVTEVHSAREALQILNEGLLPDLLITDHAMPGMTGMELAEQVRRMRPHLPILLATGYAEMQGSSVVGVPRLAKPYTQEQLAVEIARLLRPDKM